MSAPHDRLSRQHPGLKTSKAFRRQVISRAAADAGHRALYCVLAGLVDEYLPV